MGSNQKQTRQLQKEEFERLLAARKALLLEKGIEKQDLKKDSVVKHFQAQLQRTARAIASIHTTEKKVEQARFQKQERAKKMAAGKPKAKRQKPAPPPDKGQQKKEKKKKPDKK